MIVFKHQFNTDINKHKGKYITNACIPIIIIKKFLFFLLYIRMNGKKINVDNKNIKKSDFYNKIKKIFNIDDIDVNTILVSKKEQYGEYNSFKHFIGYNDNNVIRPYQAMSLMVKNKQLLENYDKIWKKN